MNLETKVIWTYVKNGLNLDLKKFFDNWNHQYQLEIIVFYHKMQNKTSFIKLSQIVGEEMSKNHPKNAWKLAVFGSIFLPEDEE